MRVVLLLGMLDCGKVFSRDDLKMVQSARECVLFQTCSALRHNDLRVRRAGVYYGWDGFWVRLILVMRGACLLRLDWARQEVNWPVSIAPRRRKDGCVWQDARSTDGRWREVMTGKWSDGNRPRARIFVVQTESDGAMTRSKVCLWMWVVQRQEHGYQKCRQHEY